MEKKTMNQRHQEKNFSFFLFNFHQQNFLCIIIIIFIIYIYIVSLQSCRFRSKGVDCEVCNGIPTCPSSLSVSTEEISELPACPKGHAHSHWHNMEPIAPIRLLDWVSMVTSDGHRQWQQWEGRSLLMPHYNNKGNLKVNGRRMDCLKTH